MWQLNRALNIGANLKNRDRIITENFYRACLQIHEIVHETFRDGPGSSEGGEPLAASLEAQVCDMFAREYQMWPLPQPVRHTAIKQLYQLARCIDRQKFGAEDTYYDRAENQATEAFLTALNP
jgi:hypothetical protein